jgi:hypothetical protein
MANRPAYELLLDSEANLRLIRTALSDEFRSLDRAGVLARPALWMLSTTEKGEPVAGTDPLDRALSLIDEMETTDPELGIKARAAIRSELRTLALRLRAQDDAARQIEKASAALGEIVERLQQRLHPGAGSA